VSDVLVSLSTEMRLKLASALTARFSARRNRGVERSASVVINTSIVAIFGAIMPEPFATPPTSTT